MSTSATVSLGSRQPRVKSHPSYAFTYGPEAVELATSAGLVADDWQSDVVDVMLAVDGERWACPEVGFVVPRQNGKGSIFEIRALAGLYLLGEPLLMWSAHEYKTAMEGFRRVQDLIDNTDDLRKRVFKVSNTNGDEGIELYGEGGKRITARQRLRFLARSKGSGRGFTGWVNLLDEWFAGTPQQVAALLPTMSAVPNPQIVYASTPPLDAATGEPLFSLKDRGESGDPGLAWFDWGAPAGVDPDDRREWSRSNPAKEIRISEETIARERRAMSTEDFLRERLGVWPLRAKDAIISTEEWQSLADAGSRRDGAIAIAFDVTPNRDHAAIAIYGLRADGLGHLEVIDHRPGTSWLVKRLVELRERHEPVAICVDVAGPAGSLLIDLDKAGIGLPEDPDRPHVGDLAIPSGREAAGACGAFVDAIRQQQLRHIDQPALSRAIAGAKPRPLGEAWAWGRRTSGVDISPLVAATLARWAYETRAHLIADDDYDVLASVF